MALAAGLEVLSLVDVAWRVNEFVLARERRVDRGVLAARVDEAALVGWADEAAVALFPLRRRR